MSPWLRTAPRPQGDEQADRHPVRTSSLVSVFCGDGTQHTKLVLRRATCCFSQQTGRPTFKFPSLFFLFPCPWLVHCVFSSTSVPSLSSPPGIITRSARVLCFPISVCFSFLIQSCFHIVLSIICIAVDLLCVFPSSKLGGVGVEGTPPLCVAQRPRPLAALSFAAAAPSVRFLLLPSDWA